MHELAIAESVVEAARNRAAGRRVSVVRLRIGRLSGVVPDALEFAFEVATAGTDLDGASLEIDDVAARATCHVCKADFTLDDPIPLCPCGSADVEIVAGRELAMVSIDVEEDVSCAAPADAETPTYG